MQNKFYLTEKLPPYIFEEIYEQKVAVALKGIEMLDFGMGNPDSAPPVHVMERLAEFSKNPKMFGYSVVGGVNVLRKALADYYKRRFNVELDYACETIVTIGAKEGIASLAHAISDEENYICVPSPCYPIHKFAYAISKSNVVQIDAIKAEDFLIEFKKFVASASKKPQAVIVSYPCNPTTEIASLEFYQELVDFCRKHEIYIISDIAYAELYFDEAAKPHSILEVKGAKEIAVEFSSVSKSFSMAGTRIGFAAGNQTLIKALYKIKSYLDYGSFTPLQLVAAEALSEKSDHYLKDLRALYKNRGEFLLNLFEKELNWKVEKPKASMFVWAKLPEKFSNISSFEFFKKLIHETGIAVTPGSAFGKSGEGFVRFSLIHNEENMTKAVARMKAVFQE